ncbi:AAA family ATPase [Paenibacillus gansuensis]|uniref:CpaE family protein n=1 Tax=Paenibacillus gansuensis TaxID=306542 RepID=A0ABW5PIV1_9BACL
MNVMIAMSRPQSADTISSILAGSMEIHTAFAQNDLQKQLTAKGDKLDYLVVDEELYQNTYPWFWISNLLQATSPNTKLIVIISEQTDSLYKEIIKRLALDLKFSIIPSLLTLDELAKEIRARVLNKPVVKEKADKGKVISFMSSAPKDGATTIAISAAYTIAAKTNKKIILVDLNLKSPEIRDHLGLKMDKGYSVIQADCDSGSLDSNMLLRACDQDKSFGNLYILTGIQRREWAEKFTLEEIESLIKVARETFDLVLIDIHTFPDQAATVKVAKEADERYVVVQPIVTSYQSSWHDWFTNVWHHHGFSEKDFQLILNRDSKEAMSTFSIERSMGTKIVANVPNVGNGMGIKAINEGLPLVMTDHEEVTPFKQSIEEFCLGLASRLDIELDGSTQLRGKWYKRILKRG